MDEDSDIGSVAPQNELSEEEMKASIDAILATYTGRSHEVRACWNAWGLANAERGAMFCIARLSCMLTCAVPHE